MRKLLGVIVILVAVVVAIGFYRNWFSVRGNREGDNPKVEVEVDKQKIQEDVRAARQRADEVIDNAAKLVDDETPDESAAADGSP
jgi:hypothetical protein